MRTYHAPLFTAVMLLLTFSSLARADAFCFSLAENYYEQVYCELQALGKGGELPGWRDFRNNDATTQALLLKRPARRAGIDIRMPLRRDTPVQPGPVDRPADPLPSPLPRLTLSAPETGLQHCSLQSQRITCDGTQFEFVSNRRNSELRPDALSADNRMDLPEFNAGRSDPRALAAYLHTAFVHYLGKMMDIGLAETTLTFTRFEFIFTDLAARRVSFRKRFETMYTYLKKDKASLAVPVSKQAPAVSMDTCQQLTESLVGCDTGRKHVLFARNPQRSTTASGVDSGH